MTKSEFKNGILNGILIILIFLLVGCFFKANLRGNDLAYAGEPPTIEEEKAPEMIPYEGKLLNIFFHPLVCRPEIAFTGDMKYFFRDWYVSSEEFTKILYELYIQDFVLVDIKEFYKVTYQDDVKTIAEQKLLIPEGKKPMVLSVDDLSYYEFTRENGSVYKLVIDENNEIAAWTDTKDGGELSYDLDIVTILEGFIKQHPDFSIRGAKGIIALTGYEGALGYRSQSWEPNPGSRQEAEKATAVATRLKELGWHFASHSFTHWNLPRETFGRFMYDTNHWDSEVRTIVGDTDLYIYPFGAALERQEDKHKVLRDRGFNLFFGVGPGYNYKFEKTYLYLDRTNIDGVYFRTYRNREDKLFDIDKVMDKKTRGIKE